MHTTSMNSLRTIQHLKSVSALWAGYPGMICAVLENHLAGSQETFRTGLGGVKDIAT